MLKSVYAITAIPFSHSGLLLDAIDTNWCLSQKRWRRRTLRPPPWTVSVYDKAKEFLDPDTESLKQQIIEQEMNVRPDWSKADSPLINGPWSRREGEVPKYATESRRVGLVARKLGMVPQWLNDGTRVLCTMLEFPDNQVVSAVDPETWFRCSLVGKRKAFNRFGAFWKITVGAINGDPFKFTHEYRTIFSRQGLPVKETLRSFLVSEDAVVAPGTPLHVCHFTVGQHVSVTGRSIDWGFQGVMHRWGMRGQPALRTTKSHRRVGAIGSKGDARVWPGRRLPGHMGYEWVTIPALEVLRIIPEKQVMYIKGSVPGEVGEILLVKDTMIPKKTVKDPPFPTFSLGTGSLGYRTLEEFFGKLPDTVVVENGELYSSKLFRFTCPSIIFTAEHETQLPGRDKTRAKLAKVKK